MGSPAPGWYDDPDHAGMLRYWDGTRWANNWAPSQQPATMPPPNNYPDAAAGWWADPQDPTYVRWWDGRQWTASRQSRANLQRLKGRGRSRTVLIGTLMILLILAILVIATA